jgi:hypothetical protein
MFLAGATIENQLFPRLNTKQVNLSTAVYLQVIMS